MKRGDLVKHIEDEVFGIIMEDDPIAYDAIESASGKLIACPPRYRIFWMDMTSSCDEGEGVFTLISEVDKDEKIC